MKQATVFSFLAIALCLACACATAQKFQPKHILFQGTQEYTPQDLLAASGLKTGAAYTTADMTAATKLLIDSGVFLNAAFKFDGADLTFTLQDNDALYPARFGNLPTAAAKELDAKLRAQLALFHGKLPTDGDLLDAVRKAEETYLAAHGTQATVVASPFTDMKLHKVTAIDLEIASPSVTVGHLDTGAAAPTSAAAFDEILTKLKGAPYDQAGTANQLATNFGNLFRDQGYLEAQVTPTEQPAIYSPASIEVPFSVAFAPGPLYKLASVQLAPGLLVSQADFDHQAMLKPGSVADHQHVLANWNYITRQYHNRGYLKADVQATPTFDRAQGTVAFAVNVVPGPVYTMGALHLINSADDVRAALRSAWPIAPGAVFNEGQITAMTANQSLSKDLQLLFSKSLLQYKLQLNDEDHTVDVMLGVVKRP